VFNTSNLIQQDKVKGKAVTILEVCCIPSPNSISRAIYFPALRNATKGRIKAFIAAINDLRS
jgi:hypothetical protein